jgi:hypothetical protein
MQCPTTARTPDVRGADRAPSRGLCQERGSTERACSRPGDQLVAGPALVLFGPPSRGSTVHAALAQRGATLMWFSVSVPNRFRCENDARSSPRGCEKPLGGKHNLRTRLFQLISPSSGHFTNRSGDKSRRYSDRFVSADDFLITYIGQSRKNATRRRRSDREDLG